MVWVLFESNSIQQAEKLRNDGRRNRKMPKVMRDLRTLLMMPKRASTQGAQEHIQQFCGRVVQYDFPKSELPKCFTSNCQLEVDVNFKKGHHSECKRCMASVSHGTVQAAVGSENKFVEDEAKEINDLAPVKKGVIYKDRGEEYIRYETDDAVVNKEDHMATSDPTKKVSSNSQKKQEGNDLTLLEQLEFLLERVGHFHVTVQEEVETVKQFEANKNSKLQKLISDFAEMQKMQEDMRKEIERLGG